MSRRTASRCSSPYRFLVGLVVGGIASLPGCLVGGAFIVLVQNSSQSISDWMKVTFSLRYDVPAWAIYGVLLILLMYFMPRGIMGGIESCLDQSDERGRKPQRMKLHAANRSWREREPPSSPARPARRRSTAQA